MRTPAQRELLTRRVAKAEAERRTLLDADYSGAIDVPTLKVEQARIGADLTAAKDRLADLDADLTERQEILELAVTFATRCGDAYRKATDRKATDRKATDRTRKQFSAAVFTRLAARRETRLAARRERRADLPPGAPAALRRHLQRARVRIRDTGAGDGNRTRVLSLGIAPRRPAADRGDVSWLVNGGARHPADRAGQRRTRDIRVISA